jgi:uncharacterized integral membrane protein
MWLKIKVWTKVTLAALLGLYVIIFVLKNTTQDVMFWWWFGRTSTTSVLILAVLAFLSGAVATVLIRTTFKTIKQIRELQRRSRQVRTERELADMKSKAGMLKTRPSTAAAVETPPADSHGLSES